jgi:signal transduction histidine kinase
MIKNGISVKTRFASDLPPLDGDRVQLQQVLLNLVVNAVEAMGSEETGSRELVIATSQNGSGLVHVAVADSGPGLAPNVAERLFDAFYTTKSSGMGMGLAISRSIVEAHGGRIRASANAPRGTVFEFDIPGSARES